MSCRGAGGCPFASAGSDIKFSSTRLRYDFSPQQPAQFVNLLRKVWIHLCLMLRQNNGRRVKALLNSAGEI